MDGRRPQRAGGAALETLTPSNDLMMMDAKLSSFENNDNSN